MESAVKLLCRNCGIAVFKLILPPWCPLQSGVKKTKSPVFSLVFQRKDIPISNFYFASFWHKLLEATC